MIRIFQLAIALLFCVPFAQGQKNVLKKSFAFAAIHSLKTTPQVDPIYDHPFDAVFENKPSFGFSIAYGLKKNIFKQKVFLSSGVNFVLRSGEYETDKEAILRNPNFSKYASIAGVYNYKYDNYNLEIPLTVNFLFGNNVEVFLGASVVPLQYRNARYIYLHDKKKNVSSIYSPLNVLINCGIEYQVKRFSPYAFYNMLFNVPNQQFFGLGVKYNLFYNE